MKGRALALILGATLASAEVKHPVRQEMVDAIKAKTSSWKPMEVNDNHLRHVPADRIRLRFGNLGSGDALGSQIGSIVQ